MHAEETLKLLEGKAKLQRRKHKYNLTPTHEMFTDSKFKHMKKADANKDK